ncbi:MAG TPA: TlpA family protein disulfide reductase [Gammaproteobacteria bacterium]|nr:TlpA family protein disulfide reductase [Gammaproteobacteria bacterium]
MKLKHLLLATLALALIGGLGALWLAPAGNTQAPNLTVTTLQGDKLSLANLRGQPVLVTFWASTCTSCIREMPHLIKLYNELAPHGFEVIGIAMAYDPPNRVIAISRAKQIPYPLALDIDHAAATAFGNVSVTPSSFLIAPDGRIVLRKTGRLDTQKIRVLVLNMLSRST